MSFIADGESQDKFILFTNFWTKTSNQFEYFKETIGEKQKKESNFVVTVYIFTGELSIPLSYVLSICSNTYDQWGHQTFF